MVWLAGSCVNGANPNTSFKVHFGITEKYLIPHSFANFFNSIIPNIYYIGFFKKKYFNNAFKNVRDLDRITSTMSSYVMFGLDFKSSNTIYISRPTLTKRVCRCRCTLTRPSTAFLVDIT